eukprot:CAMPEP_0172297494 /NCGR_PEP_ID=MMETSP1058-20130122/493_1 /TAXON_ID=83371 /ORGANISM="Detonula confervacea, Strain CCMP 353" /LENGTH=119 /DNA_ID=CAMNT_0013006651 /DNA_START=281 /DNA_END=641 /DNA_ORIENTATION=-
MPFHGQDAWRRHPLFTNLWKDPLPGFRPAVIVFSVYMIGEYAYKYMNYQMNATPQQIKKSGGHWCIVKRNYIMGEDEDVTLGEGRVPTNVAPGNAYMNRGQECFYVNYNGGKGMAVLMD